MLNKQTEREKTMRVKKSPDEQVKELNFLDAVFHALRMDDIFVKYTAFGNLIVKDFDGNRWKNEELYEFILNECLTFNPDGTLVDGLYMRDDLLKELKSYALMYGVKPN